MVSSINSDHC